MRVGEYPLEISLNNSINYQTAFANRELGSIREKKLLRQLFPWKCICNEFKFKPGRSALVVKYPNERERERERNREQARERETSPRAKIQCTRRIVHVNELAPVSIELIREKKSIE